MGRFGWTAGWIGAAAVLAGGLAPVAAAACEEGPPPPQCTNEHLTASYKRTDAGAGHVYGLIVLTNTSDETCWIRGYGGLSYVGDGDGTQIGAAAERAPSAKRKTWLGPGLRVSSRVWEAWAESYPTLKCKPAAVEGFRVYIPGEARSQYVPRPTTGCRNQSVHLLEHKAFR